MSNDTTPPSAPASLSAAPASPPAGSSQINLSWTASTDNIGVAGYRVYRDGAQVATTASITYSDTGLAPSTTYSYYVIAYDAAGNTSAQSNIDSATTLTPPDTTAPAQITNLAASNPTANSMLLSWTAPGDDGTNGTATTYDVRYYTLAINSANWDLATQVTGEPSPVSAGSSQSMTVAGLSGSTTYYFAIRTADEVPNWSGLSNVPYRTTSSPPDNTAPTAPQNLTAASIAGSGVQLSWSASTDDSGVIANYYIYRCTGTSCTSFVWLGQTFGTAGALDSYSDGTGLRPLTTYNYRVVAVDGAGNLSSPSNSVEVTTLSNDTISPSAPTGLSAAPASPPAGSSQINLSWTAATDNIGVAGYRVYRDGVIVASNVTTTTYSDTGLAPSTAYTYTVEAYDAIPNYSGQSAPASATTLPPVSLIASDISTWVGDDRTISVKIRNVGINPLTLSTVTISGDPWFTPISTLPTIAPGSEVDFWFRLLVPTGTTGGAYPNPQQYAETLVVILSTGETFNRPFIVNMYDQATSILNIQVLADNTGAPLPGAMVTLEGSAASYSTDSNGRVQITTAPGIKNVYAYKDGYKPLVLSANLSPLENNLTLRLPPGEVLVVDQVQVTPLTQQDIVDRGVELTDPTNYWVYDFTVALAIDGAPTTINQTSVVLPTNPAPGTTTTLQSTTVQGSGGGTSTIQPTVIALPEGKRAYAFLVIPGEIKLLKEFFEAKVIVKNEAAPDFVITGTTATLNIPSALALVPLNGVPQQAAMVLGDIVGGSQAEATWVVRGDAEGDHTISVDASGILQPFGMTLTASNSGLVRVYGKPAISAVFNVPTMVGAGEEFVFKIKVTNASPIVINGVSVGLDTSNFINVHLASGESPLKEIGTLTEAGAPGSTATIEFRLISEITTIVCIPRAAVYSDPQLLATLTFSLGAEETSECIPAAIRFGPNSNVTAYFAEPVNVALGNYTYSHKDIEIPGKGIPLSFTRTYNSQDEQGGPIGYGWTHNYNVSLTESPGGGGVSIRWGDGRMEYHLFKSDGTYKPVLVGLSNRLNKNSDASFTLIDKMQNKYHFSTEGRLSSMEDFNGNLTPLIYDASNRIVLVTDAGGRSLTLSYNAEGMISQVVDPVGRMITYAYDPEGNMIKVKDSNGNETVFSYDGAHQIVTIIDPKGNQILANSYDPSGRVIQQSDALGKLTGFSYDTPGKGQTTVTDPLGNRVIYTHDGKYRLTSEEDQLGRSMTYTYDINDNRLTVTDRAGNTTQYSYDTIGNVISKTDPLGNITTIEYDGNNRPTRRTDALGNATTFEYDSKGNLVRTTDAIGNAIIITYDNYGQPLTITDANGNTTTNKYDAEGYLIEVSDALGNKTTYTYDGGGRRLTATDALGRTATYTYDNNNNLLTITHPLGNVTSYTYDANNNKLTVIDPSGNTARYSYDAKDRLAAITDPMGNTITYTYDALDRKTSVTDKNGNTTSYAYDAVGNLIEVTDALGGQTAYTYDANRNKLTETDPLGNTATFAYDALNRVVRATDPLGNTSANTYDEVGRVVSTANAKGQTTGFEYDAIGKPKKVTDANGGTATYTYDANGNRLTMTEPNGNTTLYEYDTLNRLKTKTEPLGGQYQYAYDLVGNMIFRTDAKGSVIEYSYDELNRLAKITYPDASTITFAYDANGNRTVMVDSLGTSLYQYDALNRLTDYTDPIGKTVGYGYDANGSRTDLTYPDGKVVQYGYDALNRLTSVSDWLGGTTVYTYDLGGRLTRVENPNATTAAYTYDATGRMTGLANSKGDGTNISSYSYTLDTIGNHTQVTQEEPLLPVIPVQNNAYTYDNENRLTDAGGTANAFDANGNITAKGSDAFSYDYNDRLIQSNIGGVITQYRYDGLGNRLMKVEGGVTGRYIQDISGRLNNVLAESDGSGSITAYYVYGLGLISKILPDGTAYYYHYDSRGSTVALTEAGQNITDAYAYDPFGKLANSVGSTANPFRYVGRYGVMEEGNGLQYIRARYYAPDLGRFITKDQLSGLAGDNQSLNRYAYAMNDPVRFVDVSGFSRLEGGAGGGGGVAEGSSDEFHNVYLNSQPSYMANLREEAIKYFAGDIAEKIANKWLRESFVSYSPWDHYGMSMTTKYALKGLSVLDVISSGIIQYYEDSGGGMDPMERAAKISLTVSVKALTNAGKLIPVIAPFAIAADVAYDMNKDIVFDEFENAVNKMPYVNPLEEAGKAMGNVLFELFW